MYILENDQLKVTLKSQGGELTDIYHKENDLHYLHDANPKYWNRHAPVLFPIVGRLKEDRYTYQGKEYSLTQHGFARDYDFEVAEQTATKIDFVLKSTEKMRENYPFDFELHLIYGLIGEKLTCTYLVKNTSEKEVMYFSIGGHPAFNLPLEKGLTFEDYTLTLQGETPRKHYRLSGASIDLAKTEESSQETYPLNYDLFKNDAIIFETKGPQTFTLASDKGSHGLNFSYDGFKFIGFWTPYGKNAPFLCIEPWCGIADTTDATGELTEKFGIEKLLPKENFSQAFVVEFF